MSQSPAFAPEFADDAMARPRYTGLATFMRAPYREDLAGVDIGLIGVPFDGGVTNRTGRGTARARCATRAR